jgi:3-methyladenine DNA glycosylase AlkD
MPFVPNQAVAFFRTRFRAAGRPERVAGEKAYMKSSLAFHGVTAGDVRSASRELCRAHPELTRPQLLALVEALYATDYFDLRSAGLAVLEKRAALLEADDAEWLIDLARRSANWAHVDYLAIKTIGQLVAAHPQLLRRLRVWAKDPSFWVRRVALLAQLEAFRVGEGDFARFAAIAAPLLPDKEFFIRKAIGWVLREVGKKRPELTYEFLRAHRDQLSGLTLREGARRLPPALRDRLISPGSARV